MSTDNGVFVFPDVAKAATNGLDPNLMLALSQNGGFGNNGYWIWILFMWLIWGNNGNGFGNGNGTGYLANQMSNDAGRDLLLQAINGRADAIQQLANITNGSVQQVQNAVNVIQSSIQSVGQQVGMSGLQVQNAIQSGNASLSQQLCQCCCENNAAIANQTNALQSQIASNHAASTLQSAQDSAALQLAMSQQTNQLGGQSDRNTQSVINAIANQTAMINREFCNLKDRDYQNKIDQLTADNALLRSNINNINQTQQFAGMLAPIQGQLAAISAKQPQTITLPLNQYSVVPSWYASAGSDLVANYFTSVIGRASGASEAVEAAKVGV